MEPQGRLQMKKDRIVALCICVLLLGNMQVQHMTGIRQLGFPSLPEFAWAIATGKPSCVAGYSLPGTTSLRCAARSGWITAAVHAGWPQLGFVYDQILLLKSKWSSLPAHSADGRNRLHIP